ncbi:MAG: phenylalanine--tRNA ligase subunit beta [Saprospiraceae bacterium]|nr:phenylalanine--tRNA ligase subunit beta [Saprospiraceae bacterium]MBL0082030.1 phenylalanine--tRNA ligase subunit beta [Saprospiraceae bacterium]
MKCSLNGLKRYIELSENADQIAQMLTAIGLEVEGQETIQNIKGGLKGVVTGQVLTCSKHPDADKLSVTTVDIGTDSPQQIVCGAPNVAAGQKVLVATIGAVLYPGGGEALTIKKAKIRGVESNGMICAADELGLGNDHSGILVLPAETPVGQPASTLYEIHEDTLYEIGLTPNRSDATCHFGVARDLYAYIRSNVDHTRTFNEPGTSDFNVENHTLEIKVEVKRPDLCPRYSGLTISGITIGPSPAWLQNHLTVLGVKPINNVVDATNFILHDLGQPLHAFDVTKIGGNAIAVDVLPKGSKFLALDGKEIELKGEELMICDGNGNGMCIGGVYGGKESGVSDQTTAIFLESAHFAAGSIRRTSMGHNLRTDAAKIFEKGSDPNLTVFALKKAATLIVELTGGYVSSEITDIYPKEIKPAEIHVRYSNVYDLLGTEIPKDTIHNILSGMGMQVLPVDDHGFKALVPTSKADVLREVDVIEEILRIYGFNKVNIPARVQSTLSYAPQPNKFAITNQMADFLVGKGFNEMMGLSLIDSKLCLETLGLAENDLVLVNNTSNAGLDAMRPSLLLSGLISVAHNLNRQANGLRLFELGKSYLKKGDDFMEKEELALMICGQQAGGHWSQTQASSAGYHSLKQTVGDVLRKRGLNKVKFRELEGDGLFAYGLEIMDGKEAIGKMGEIHPKVLKKMGIKMAVYGASLDVMALVNAQNGKKHFVTEISRFPSVQRDLAIVIDKSINYQKIQDVVRSKDHQYLVGMDLFDVYANEEVLGTDKKSYALSFVFENKDKTLTDNDIDTSMKSIIELCQKQLGANIRSS